MKFQNAVHARPALIFRLHGGICCSGGATAGEYSSMLRFPLGSSGDADVVDEAPLRQAADWLRSPSPSSLVLGLLVACLVCVGMPGLEYRPAAQAQALQVRSRPERLPGIEAGAGRRDSPTR